MATIPKGGGFSRPRAVKPGPVVSAPLAPDAASQGRFNAETEAAVRSVAGCPLVTGRRLAVGALTTTPTRVPHGLGRVPLGWFPVGVTADATVWDGAAPDDAAIYLSSSSSVAEWTLWVF